MPIYSYQCSKCEYQWDDMRSITDADEPTYGACPSCEGQNTTKRIMSPTNFHLKGTGWYKQVKQK